MYAVVGSRLATLVVAASCVLSAGAARAADPAATQARRHFEQGNKAFKLGELERAIAEFKRAYAIKPDPILLYNIGQAYRLSNEPERAVFFYRSYLRNLPDASNRREVEERIRTLEEQIAGRAPGDAPARPAAPEPVAPPPPPAPAAPPPAASDPGSAGGPDVTAVAPGPAPPGTDRPSRAAPIYTRWWFWTAVGAGAAAIVLGALALSAAGPDAPASEFPVQSFPR